MKATVKNLGTATNVLMIAFYALVFKAASIQTEIELIKHDGWTEIVRHAPFKNELITASVFVGVLCLICGFTAIVKNTKSKNV